MKRFIAVIISIAIVTLLLSGCSNKTETPENTEAQISTGENPTEAVTEEKELYDTIDNLNVLCMKCGEGYTYVKDANLWSFSDGQTAISYSDNLNRNPDGIPADIEDFSLYFFQMFKKARIYSVKQNFTFSKTGTDVINGFDVNVYSGMLIDDYDEEHTVKAYTFVANGIDCVVMAAPVENTDEMIAKMEKDIDIFMNNLYIAE